MLHPGESFERYTVDAVLGQGGMGTVYRAVDARLERRVALKVIAEGSAGAESHARLLREARAAAALDHPNAVSIFDVGELDGAPYIVMELVEGRTLREALSDDAPLATRVGWLADVGRVLAAAHRRGLIHRDIKPENVMVRDDGVVKVLDFGIARSTRTEADPDAPTQAPDLPTLTREGARIGTPLYMAPEHIRGAVLDGRSDEFAWGVLAHEVLTGRLPWARPADAMAVLAAILTDEPDGAALEAAGVPTELGAIVLRTLERRREDRFATMDELVDALDRYARGESMPPPPARPRLVASGGDAGPGPAANEPGPPPAGATTLQRFSTAEVRDVLSRALEQERAEHAEADTRLGFDDLLAAAREVGVDEAALREASRELRAHADAEPPSGGFDVWRRRKRRSFSRHLGIYLIVNAAFFVLGLVTGTMWTMMPALWWGIGVAIHALKAFTAHEDDYQEEQERRAKRDLRRRKHHAAVARVIEEGAAMLRATGTRRRQRIAGAPDHAPGKRIGAEEPSAQTLEALAELDAESEGVQAAVNPDVAAARRPGR